MFFQQILRKPKFYHNLFIKSWEKVRLFTSFFCAKSQLFLSDFREFYLFAVRKSQNFSEKACTFPIKFRKLKKKKI